MASDAPYTLAHLSDVHLGPLPLVPLGLINAKRLAGALNWYRKRQQVHLPKVADALVRDIIAQAPDHIVMSGDLTNLGLPEEITRGATWLSGLGPPDRVSVVPGNHDIYSAVRGRRLGVSALAPWAPHFASDPVGGRIAGAQPFPYVRILGGGAVRIALIGLNSAVETPPMIARGLLGSAQREAFARALDRARTEGLTRVVVLHHPPLPGLTSDHHALSDAAELQLILRQHGAELVLHGHTHRRMINTFAGPYGAIPIIGVPSASAARSYKGEPLSRAHFFEFARNTARQNLTISLVARGLAEPGGAIVEIERTVLT
jgi:3',5'-cyclic AMP phosphodiesterase CpdA